jgi:hypothetical protein
MNRHRTTVTALAIAAALAASAARADDAAPAEGARPVSARAPSYRWLETSWAWNYAGLGDLRLRSDAGFRATTNFRLLPHLYLVGAFDYQDYNGPEFKFGSAGLGTYFSVYTSTDWYLNATWENANLDGDTGAGWGAQTGFRTLLTRYGEWSLYYKYSEYEDSAFPGAGNSKGFKHQNHNMGGSLSLPLSKVLDLTVRIENLNVKETAPGAAATNYDLENFLVGFRARF